MDVRYLATEEPRGGKIAEGARHAPISFYRDGRQLHIANSPVAFEVPGGTVEVAIGAFWPLRMHLVPSDDGPARPCARTPAPSRACAPASAGATRASRVLGALAIVVLLIGVVLMLPQAGADHEPPPVAERVGAVTPRRSSCPPG